MYQMENGVKEREVSPYKRDISSIQAELGERRNDLEEAKSKCKELEGKLRKRWRDWVKDTIPKLRWRAGKSSNQKMMLNSSPPPGMSDVIEDIHKSNTFLFRDQGFKVEVSQTQIRLIEIEGSLESFLVFIKDNDLKFVKEYE